MVELSLKLTPAMALIYDSVAELMEACLKELKRSNKVDATDLSVQNSLFRSFDEIVKRQLEAVWHTVSPKTKQVGCARTEGPPRVSAVAEQITFISQQVL